MDWIDIVVHIIVAFVAVFVLSWGLGFPWVFILIANAIFWPAREALQHRPDYREIITRPQPLLEWLCPVLTGFLMYGVF